MSPLRLGLSIWPLLGWAFVAFAEKVRYDIICDAGSTGTRMYLFTSTFSVDDAGKETMKVSTEVIGKKKPGLSSYVANPREALPPLLQLFGKVREKIPQEQWAETPVLVLGTAGMRTLKPPQQWPIYDAIRQGLVFSDDYVFSSTDEMLKMRTLTGTEEGTFSMLCVNFLTGRIDHHLALTNKGSSDKLLGILDLGGSSTQIAVPPANAEEEKDLRGATMVRSYAAYGMEQMRGRLDKHVKELGMTESPCYFKGYKDAVDGFLGSGNASSCREALHHIFLSTYRDHCKDGGDRECMPGMPEDHAFVTTSAAKGVEFFAVSGYLFVTDFGNHWLQRTGTEGGMTKILQKVGNRPTIVELEAAADELCLSDWAPIESATAGGKATGAHRYTDPTKAPHRCLEISYVTTLLRAYGFPTDKRFVTFEDEVDGNDVEWPLGALLHTRHEAAKGTGHGQEL